MCESGKRLWKEMQRVLFAEQAVISDRKGENNGDESCADWHYCGK